MLARKLPLATFLTVALVAADSYACGPFFPNYLLENRNARLCPLIAFLLKNHLIRQCCEGKKINNRSKNELL